MHTPEAQVVANSLEVVLQMVDAAQQAQQSGTTDHELSMLGQAVIICRIAAHRLRTESWASRPDLAGPTDDVARLVDDAVAVMAQPDGRLGDDHAVLVGRIRLASARDQLVVLAGSRKAVA